MNNLIDAHCHAQFSAYDSDREAVIKRARDAGIKMIVAGTNFNDSKAAIELAHKYPNDIWATVGFHPHHAAGEEETHSASSRQEEFNIEKLRKLAEDKKVVAIGECGLDYYQLNANCKTQIAKQKEVFLKMAELATELNKPLVIHARPHKGTDDAYEDVLNSIFNYQFPIFKIAHFYAGSLDMAKKFVEAGFYFTFGGVLTITRDYDEVVKYIPLEKIMLETDAPYVAPAPYRGERNEPAYIVETAKKMAEIKGISLEKVAETTFKNAKTIYKI